MRGGYVVLRLSREELDLILEALVKHASRLYAEDRDVEARDFLLLFQKLKEKEEATRLA